MRIPNPFTPAGYAEQDLETWWTGFVTACWRYCLRDRWVAVAMVQTAGASLNWFKNAFDKDNASLRSRDIFEQCNQLVQESPDGCGGLIFLPYLNGERTPYWDSSARGLFYGITLSSEKAHLSRR